MIIYAELMQMAISDGCDANHGIDTDDCGDVEVNVGDDGGDRGDVDVNGGDGW